MIKKRMLLALVEPPPTSSGLGVLWAKLGIAVTNENFQIDFVGPDPKDNSPFPSNGMVVPGRAFYFSPPPLARRLEVKRNRSLGFARMFWSALYTPFFIARKYLSVDFCKEWIAAELIAAIERARSEVAYDVIAVHAPPFEYSKYVFEYCAKHDLKMLWFVGDPIGYRDGQTFFPFEKNLQQEIIDYIERLVVTKETYAFYYSKTFKIPAEKVAFFSDCYVKKPFRLEGETIGAKKNHQISMVHWGAIPPWRSLGKLANALVRYNMEFKSVPPLKLRVCGRITDKSARIDAAKLLGDAFEEIPMGAYLHSRRICEDADILIAIVSPRHLDNIPSKLIEYFSFRKPILLLAPSASSAASLVISSGVGLVAEPENEEELFRSIIQLVESRDAFVGNYHNNKVIDSFESKRVGDSLRDELLKVIG